jgi:PKD repeat protein
LLALLLSACDPAATPPTPSFSLAPATGTAPLTVQFTDTSAAGSAPITAWAWTFGDGQGSTDRNPSHVYAQAGVFNVTLSVTTTAGTRSTTRNAAVTVTAPVPPTARFTATPLAGFAPLAVQFTDTSTAGSQPVTAWLWTFGDGQTSTQRNPSHAYAAPGTYTVSLRVTTAAGENTATRSNFITVTAPDADPVITLDRVAANDGVFTPGGTLDLTVTLTSTPGNAITALGILETLPDGWAFVEIVSGAEPPGIINPAGETGDLELAWFDLPTLPTTFTYRVSVPQDASAEEVLSGVAKYRTAGVELNSNTVITVLGRAGG